MFKFVFAFTQFLGCLVLVVKWLFDGGERHA